MSTAAPPPRLSHSAARGILWTGAGQVIRQLVQVGTSLILVRLLVPADFGLMGMAMFFVGIGQLLADFGIGAAIVHSRTNDRVILSSCFWLNVAVAGTLAIALVITAPLIAEFYKRADLVPLVSALSLNLLLSGLLVVPSALLSRGMRFAALARGQVFGSLVGAVVAVTLAWSGAGVWALIAQPLCGGVTTLIGYGLAQRWYPGFEFSWSQVRSLARFSASLLASNLIGYMNRNVDALLVGRVLGAVALGHYSMAIQLMLYPLQQISSVFVRVLIPTLVHLQEDLPRLRSAYLKTSGCIALLTFPIMGGLCVLADDFVMIAFGPNWEDLAPVLKVLAWVGMLQSVGTTVGAIYVSTGKPAIGLRVTLISSPVIIGGMAAGLPWGILGVAIGYAIASFSFFYYSVSVAFKVINLSLSDFHRVLLRPLSATLVMIASLTIMIPALKQLSPTYRLSLNVFIGAIVYLAVTLIINRAQIVELFSIARSLRSKA